MKHFIFTCCFLMILISCNYKKEEHQESFIGSNLEPIEQIKQSQKMCIGLNYDKINYNTNIIIKNVPWVSLDYIDNFAKNQLLQLDNRFNLLLSKYVQEVLTDSDRIVLVNNYLAVRFFSFMESDKSIFPSVYFLLKPNGEVRVVNVLYENLYNSQREFNLIYYLYDTTYKDMVREFDFLFTQKKSEFIIDSTFLLSDFFWGYGFVTTYSNESCQTEYIPLLYNDHDGAVSLKISKEHKQFLNNFDNIFKRMKTPEKPIFIFN